MKKLSIGEKAHRYDEAIERAKAFKEHLLEINEKDYADEMDYVFPELKESEDEKVRKSIIAILNNYVDNSNTFKPKMIAWLEKQGQTFTKKDVDDAYIKGVFDAKKEFEKQDSQLLDNSAKTCKDEKETTWSDEDERNLQGIIAEIEANKNQAPGHDIKTYNRFLNWLKSLKNRYTWKPSDEQMQILHWCMPLWVEPKSKAILESLINDLKKLKG